MRPVRTADQETIRKVNTSIVLNTLRLRAPISRAEVAGVTGLNRSTVSNIVNALIEEGLVVEQELQGSRVGRPSISLSLRPEGGAVIGVELGVDFIAIMLTDFVANVLWQDWIEFDAGLPQLEVILKAEAAISQALQAAARHDLRPLGIGVGLPGLVNVHQGELVFAPNTGWRDVPLRLMWNQRFRLPIYVDNEANLAALGEYYFGLARSVDNFIYLASGVGLGAGVIIDGKLYRGGSGFAGEVGHIQRDPSGELCGCGRIGCWETQVGPRPVLRRVKAELQRNPGASGPLANLPRAKDLTFKMVVDAALAGDPLCRQALEEMGMHLGLGIADLVNIFNPELVIIGGVLSLARPLLLPVIEKAVFSQALSPSVKNLRVAFSEHGPNASQYGAVAAVLDDILRELAII